MTYTGDMDIILQTNIFFYITSAAVLVVTGFAVVALYYLIGILRDVKDVSDKVKTGTDLVAADLAELRAQVKKGGAKARQLMDFFVQSRKRSSAKKQKDGRQ